MERKSCLKFCLSLIFLMSGLFKENLKAQSSNDKPNVLVIITGDQRYNTIHALGNGEIVTPTMDKLVEDGTTFTQAHIMGGMGGAICMASRAQLLSGRSLYHLHKDGTYIPEGDVTFPELFRK